MGHLSNRETRTIKALAEVLIPQDGTFQYGYKDIDTVSFFEDFLSHAPLKVRWFLFFNLWVFEYISWISLKTPGLFSKMKFDHREKIILKMRENKYYLIRGIYLLTSIVLLMSFYSDERVMNKIGYFGYKEGENKVNK